MKTVLFIIIFNFIGIYSYAQQGEYNQISTQGPYNLACKQNKDGSMNCIKINKTQEETAQAVVKEQKSDSSSIGSIIFSLVMSVAIIYWVLLSESEWFRRNYSCR